ncbi:MAG: U32 family peptidase, partial [Defluviitaleaceae bacterium]|nr:U32 family peptidase [Defluviitaleaceae bacterium]
AIQFANSQNVKVFLAINTLVTDREISDAMKIVDRAYEAGAAAFIVQDIGLARAMKARHEKIVLHASTQTTATTADDVNALEKLGFARVVLAREISRAQIKKIAEVTRIELEIFVHGALCSSYSGQCLMSSFIGGRSANRGKCAQPCRLPYTASPFEANEHTAAHSQKRNKSAKKSGVLLSLKDLCLIDYVEELTNLGVAALKIEGRMKGEDYVRAVVGAYRAVLDGVILTEKQKKELLSVFDRGGYTDGYFTGNHEDMYMNTLTNPYEKSEKCEK